MFRKIIIATSFLLVPWQPIFGAEFMDTREQHEFNEAKLKFMQSPLMNGANLNSKEIFENIYKIQSTLEGSIQYEKVFNEVSCGIKTFYNRNGLRLGNKAVMQAMCLSAHIVNMGLTPDDIRGILLNLNIMPFQPNLHGDGGAIRNIPLTPIEPTYHWYPRTPTRFPNNFNPLTSYRAQWVNFPDLDDPDQERLTNRFIAYSQALDENEKLLNK